MRYTNEMDEWLKINFPNDSVNKTLARFNNNFNLNVSYLALKTHCNRKLHLTSGYHYTNEQIAFIIENYGKQSNEQLSKKFFEKYNRKVCKEHLVEISSKHNIYFEEKYSKEEDEFIKANVRKYTEKELTELFNKKFNRSVKISALRSHTKRKLKLPFGKLKNFFTKQEKEWLQKNWINDEQREETYKKYCKKFGKNHTFIAICNCAKRINAHKPETRIKWQKGNKPWSAGLEHNEYKSHFTEESYKKMTYGIKNNKIATMRKELEVPKGYVMSDLGNGEKIIIPAKIYKCMQFRKTIGKGDITKTDLEIYKVKNLIGEMKKDYDKII